MGDSVCAADERQKVIDDIRQIRIQLRDLGIRLMDIQEPFDEPRTTVLSALDKMNVAENFVRNL